VVCCVDDLGLDTIRRADVKWGSGRELFASGVALGGLGVDVWLHGRDLVCCRVAPKKDRRGRYLPCIAWRSYRGGYYGTGA